MGYFSYKICMHNSRPLTFYLFLHYVLHCTLPLNAFFLFASTFYNWKKKLFFWITTCNSNSVAPAKSNQCAAYETNFSIIKANHWFFLFYSPFFIQHFFYSTPQTKRNCRMKRVHMMMIDSVKEHGRHSPGSINILL